MTLELAIREAYASNPVDELILDTLEFHHPAFVDDFGERTAIRIVRANEAQQLKLEDSAPLHGGQYVEFLPVPFDFSIPGYAEGEVPSLSFSVANVSRLITKYLELAIAQTEKIVLIYRPYLASDTSEPQTNPVTQMSVAAAEVGTFQVTGTATLSDVHNWPFPSKKYTPSRFPGLNR